MTKKTPTVSIEKIDRTILLLRGRNVILDAELARLYEVSTSALNQAVRRNMDRFPEDFMFQLTKDETETLLSQTVIASMRRFHPYAFTEQGVAMLSSVLNSKRAIQVNIEIMRAFVRMRRFIESYEVLAEKVAGLEKKYDAKFAAVFAAILELDAFAKKTAGIEKKYGAQFKAIFKAVRELMKPPDRKQIGYVRNRAKKK